MLVETYEINEVDADGVVECEDEALELIEKLNLCGQRELVTVPEDTGLATRIPYPKMTHEQKRVIQAICPAETDIAKYKDGIIPLRVLQVAAYAKDVFHEVLVWHPKNADEKDPYLIGKNTINNTREYFILARWGDELLPWNELREKAVEKMRQLRISALQEIVSTASAAIEATKVMPADGLFKKSTDPSISDYYWQS